MRRPLCLLGLAFAMVLLLGINLISHDSPDYGALDGEMVAAVGRVAWKEHRISGSEEVLVVTLEHTVILKPDEISVLKQIIADSDKALSNHIAADSVKKTENDIEEKKESLTRKGTEEITGILCYLGKEENPAMGSLILVEGKFRPFSHATNPGEFDAADYYRVAGQQGRLMKAACLAESEGSSAFREGLYRVREYLALLLDVCYPQEEASVMCAMLLGEKAMLDGDIKSLYQQNGIIHILAISGLHISILGMGFHTLLQRMHVPKAINIMLSLALMYCYGTMTGMGVSIVRAYVMFGLKLGADLCGRTYDLLTAMMTAALLLLVQQPLYLTQSGFLFSFGAVCGIGFLPSVSRHFPTVSGRFPIGNLFFKALFTGGWISLCTLPVYLCFYYEFPPYSVLLNLVVIPCMGVLLPSGIVVMGAAVCFLPLGRLAALPGIWILGFYEKICSLCVKLPGQRLITGRPQNWQVIVFLGILAAAVVLAVRMKRRYFFCALLGAVFLLTIRLPRGFEITMLDIGQGDCIYLADGQGGHYLIDGGSSDRKEVENYQIAPFLKYRGVRRLQAVFVTHSDADHISGIKGLLKDYGETGIGIGCLFLPDLSEECKDENYLELVALAHTAGVPVRYIHAGNRLQSGKVMLTCMHPTEYYVNSDANAGSTVLYLTYENFSALFTGDLEGEGEELVTERLAAMKDASGSGTPRLTLLKTAHHGSKNSTKESFLALVSPRIALISAGRDNSYGHPHEETLERLQSHGCRIYQTPESGAVTVRVKNGSVRVEEFLMNEQLGKK